MCQTRVYATWFLQELERTRVRLLLAWRPVAAFPSARRNTITATIWNSYSLGARSAPRKAAQVR